MKLNLTRPIIFFDLETTGTNITHDRIVEISVVKVYPDGTRQTRTRRINPGVHIPAEATAVHHISDEDVKDEPSFAAIAKGLLQVFEGCDIAGFNSNKFDVPLLVEEFARAGIRFNLTGRRFIDVQTIYHRMEQRTLSAAYKFYCGKNLDDAHSAAADTEATYQVLLSQLERYPDLQNDVDFLHSFSNQNDNIDLAGRIVRDSKGEPVFHFGKYRGQSVREVLKKDPSYYNWMLQGDFPQNTKDVMTALKAQFAAEK